MTTNTNRTTLSTSKDWQDWYKDFYAQVKARELIDVVFNDREPLSAPIPPDEEAYSRRFPVIQPPQQPPATPSVEDTRTARQRRTASERAGLRGSQAPEASSSSGSQQTIRAAHPDDITDGPEAGPATQPVSPLIIDISEKAMTAYRHQYGVYRDKRVIYDAQLKSILSLTTYLQDTVDSKLKRTCFLEEASIADWFKALTRTTTTTRQRRRSRPAVEAVEPAAAAAETVAAPEGAAVVSGPSPTARSSAQARQRADDCSVKRVIEAATS
jgi:hypothetical protein